MVGVSRHRSGSHDRLRVYGGAGPESGLGDLILFDRGFAPERFSLVFGGNTFQPLLPNVWVILG